MSSDSELLQKWTHLDTLSRADVYHKAIEDLMDVRGLSKIKEILKEYNLSYVCIDYKLKMTVKRSSNYCPRKELGKSNL